MLLPRLPQHTEFDLKLCGSEPNCYRQMHQDLTLMTKRKRGSKHDLEAESKERLNRSCDPHLQAARPHVLAMFVNFVGARTGKLSHLILRSRETPLGVPV